MLLYVYFKRCIKVLLEKKCIIPWFQGWIVKTYLIKEKRSNSLFWIGVPVTAHLLRARNLQTA